MPYDGLVMDAVTKELEAAIVGGLVNKVSQPAKETVILHIYNHGREHYLLLSARADAARVHLTRKGFKNPPHPPVFCMVLRKHLEGARVTSVAQQGLERVLNVWLDTWDGTQPRLLSVEVMGKHSNVLLIDPASGTILDGIKRYGTEVSRHREVFPGCPYVPPPGQAKVDPRDLTENLFYQLLLDHPLDHDLNRALAGSLAGVSPLTCSELVFRAGLPIETALESCGQYELSRLWRVVEDLASTLRQGCPQPTLVRDATSWKEFSALDLTLFPPDSREHPDTMNQALETYYSVQEEKRAVKQRRDALRQVADRAMKKVSRKDYGRQQDAAGGADAESHRSAGQAILINIYRMQRGDTKLVAEDLENPGKTMVVALDPRLSPSDNAQRYFRRYARARNALARSEQLLAETTEEISYLDSVLLSLVQAETLDDLEAIAEELEREGYLKETKTQKPKNLKPTPMVFSSGQGFTILVGRNNRQNDHLTLRMASPGDLWLHVKEFPGAHVLIKTEGNDPPDETVLEAASLAAYFSKARESQKVPVDCTQARFVRKPRGARPGMVIYDHYKTIMVAPNPEMARHPVTN